MKIELCEHCGKDRNDMLGHKGDIESDSTMIKECVEPWQHNHRIMGDYPASVMSPY